MDIEVKYKKQQDLFIQALVKILPFVEWSDGILEEASIKCDFDKSYHYVLFPDGLDSIVDAFEFYQDKLMLQYLDDQESPLKIREKIALALKIRIKECVPKIIHQKNASYFAYPANAILGLKVAARTCDLIWRYAGDDSTDFNYYTKRGLLLSVYLSSLFHYMNDSSIDSSDTEKFIDEFLAKVINIANLKNLIKAPKLEDIPFIRIFS